MTTAEELRACARAMGLSERQAIDGDGFIFWHDSYEEVDRYDPRTNGEQAMALLETFLVECFSVLQDCAHEKLMGRPYNLKAAIVSCVARVQLAKESKDG